MRRVVDVLLCLCLVCCLFHGVPVKAETLKSGDWVYEVLDDGTVEISGYEGSDKVVKIPETMEGKSVTSIGGYAFEDCSSMTSITIPNSVTTIGKYAFSGCSSLANIVIPKSVTSMGEDEFGGYPFIGCSLLTDIKVESGSANYASKDGILYNEDLTELKYCPEGKSGSVVIPNSVDSIRYDAFEYCLLLTEFNVESDSWSFVSQDGMLYKVDDDTGELKELLRCPPGKRGVVNIPDGVITIEEHAFENCTSLTSIVIPNSVVSIEFMAFFGCTVLTEVTIPNGVTSIGGLAFANCTSLTGITIPNSVTGIGSWAFEDCTSLTDITIPSSVTSIDNDAFDGCSSLENINVESDSKDYASKDGVLYNKDLTALLCCPEGKSGTVVIPKSVTDICGLSDCSLLTDIDVESGSKHYASYDGVLYNQDLTEIISCPRGKRDAIVIPDGVISISGASFDGCSLLKEITIPGSVEDIGGYRDNAMYVFQYCESLLYFNVDAGSPYYASKDGILYNKDFTILLCCPQGKSGVIDIPESVTKVDEMAFNGCSSITGVTIPKGVTSVGDFGQCSSLTEINVEQGSQYYASKDGILYNKDFTLGVYCPKGRKGAIVVPDGVIDLGGLFFDCGFVTEITIPASVTKMDVGNFRYCESLSTIYGIAGSYVEKYLKECAELHDIKFVAIGTPQDTEDTELSTAHTHTPVTDAAVAPTCTTSGKTEGSHCAECGEVIQAPETIPATGHTYEQRITQATNRQDGSIVEKCSICGDVKSNLPIYAASHITLSKTAMIYNGKSQRPKVTVKDSQGVAISADNYEITYPKSSKKVGEYTVSVTLKGNYTGTVQLKYQIAPKGTSISKLTAKKKGFAVKWKKQTKETTGYQIQYSTSSNFKGAKTVMIDRNKTVSKEIKKLKAGKKYYVRIRTYKTVKVDGKNKKIYSDWSKGESIKTKR